MRGWIALAAFALVAAAPSPDAERKAIFDTIAAMEAAWNRGDFPGYMAGFANPGAEFVSGGKFLDGWQGRLDQYLRDYGGGSAERRGELHFYDMRVDFLAPDAALLVGKYRLLRGPRHTEGVNTRLFRKIDGRWLITHNHVSAYDVTSAPSAGAERGGPPSRI